MNDNIYNLYKLNGNPGSKLVLADQYGNVEIILKIVVSKGLQTWKPKNVANLDGKTVPVYTWEHIVAKSELGLVKPIWQSQLGIERGMTAWVALVSWSLLKTDAHIALDCATIQKGLCREFWQRLVSRVDRRFRAP